MRSTDRAVPVAPSNREVAGLEGLREVLAAEALLVVMEPPVAILLPLTEEMGELLTVTSRWYWKAAAEVVAVGGLTKVAVAVGAAEVL
jgi:hypothetical protein